MNKSLVAAMHHSGEGESLSRTETKSLSFPAHTPVAVLTELPWIPNLNLVNLENIYLKGFLFYPLKRDFFKNLNVYLELRF